MTKIGGGKWQKMNFHKRMTKYRAATVTQTMLVTGNKWQLVSNLSYLRHIPLCGTMPQSCLEYGSRNAIKLEWIFILSQREIIHTNGNADNRIYNHGVKFTGLSNLSIINLSTMVGENFELYWSQMPNYHQFIHYGWRKVWTLLVTNI